MPSPELRRHRRLERPRERVLQTAWDLLVERGLADLSLSELGRRLDTSAGHLAYYFGSKNNLLLQLLQWSEEELIERLEALVVLDQPAEERLRGFCELYFPTAAGDPRWLLWVELWPRVIRDPELREAQQQLDGHWRSVLERLLPELTDADPAPLAQRMMALLDGLSVSLLIDEPGLTLDEAVDHIRSLIN